MNFFFGLLVIAIAILTLRTVMKAAGAILHRLGGLRSVFRKRRTMRYRSIPFRTGPQVINPTNHERAWEALSSELRKEILARGVRASSQSRKVSQLDEAIEIEKREIELARLKAEKSQIKARHKSVRSTVQSDRKRQGAAPSVVPIAQLQAMREATRIGRSLPHKLSASGTVDVDLSKRQAANPQSSLHH